MVQFCSLRFFFFFVARSDQQKFQRFSLLNCSASTLRCVSRRSNVKIIVYKWIKNIPCLLIKNWKHITWILYELRNICEVRIPILTNRFGIYLVCISFLLYLPIFFFFYCNHLLIYWKDCNAFVYVGGKNSTRSAKFARHPIFLKNLTPRTSTDWSWNPKQSHYFLNTILKLVISM